MSINKNRRFLRRVTPTCTIFIEVQADHGGMKITSCEILPAIVCYSSPEAKYGSLAVRNGNGRIWWKRFYMEPRSTRCKRFMSEWKRSRNVCHRAWEARTLAERPFGMTPWQKNWDWTKTAAEHGVRFNTDKTAQERMKLASGGDGG